MKQNIIYKYRRLITETAVYVLITVLAAMAAKGIYNYRHTQNIKEFLAYDYIYNDVNVNNINLGGLTKEQAVAVLEQEVQQVYNAREVNIINPLTGEVYPCNFGMCGADYDFEKAVDGAYNYGRTGTLEENFNNVYKLKNISYFTHADYETNQEVLSELIDGFAKKIEQSNNVKINRELAVKTITEMVDNSLPGDVVLPIEY